MSNLSGFLTSSDDKDSLTTGLPKRLRDGLWSKNPEDLNPWQIDVLTAADRIERLEQTFDLRWSADMRAIEIWRKDNPGNELVMPDHTDLCVWLLARVEKLEEALQECKSALEFCVDYFDGVPTIVSNAMDRIVIEVWEDER